jgi:hypothetical protein
MHSSYLWLFPLLNSRQERDGWYTSHSFERIKSILRHKFFSVLEGHPATDEECRTLLASSENSTKSSSLHRNQKLRAGKHNMAKGALRPEDAAVRSHPCASFNSPLTRRAGHTSESDAGSKRQVLHQFSALSLGRTLYNIDSIVGLWEYNIYHCSEIHFDHGRGVFRVFSMLLFGSETCGMVYCIQKGHDVDLGRSVQDGRFSGNHDLAAALCSARALFCRCKQSIVSINDKSDYERRTTHRANKSESGVATELDSRCRLT